PSIPGLKGDSGAAPSNPPRDPLPSRTPLVDAALEDLSCADDGSPVDRDLGAGQREPGKETRFVGGLEISVPSDLQGNVAALDGLQVGDVLDGRVQSEFENTGTVLTRRADLVLTGKVFLPILEGIRGEFAVPEFERCPGVPLPPDICPAVGEKAPLRGFGVEGHIDGSGGDLLQHAR